MTNNTEIERGILGACLIEPKAVYIAIDQLRADYFYLNEHQLIFAAIAEMSSANRVIDLVTLCEHLEKSGELDKVGGKSYIASLTSGTITSGNIKTYIASLVDLAQRRAAIRIGQDLIARAQGQEEIMSSIGKTGDELFLLESMGDTGGPVEIGTIAGDVYESIMELHAGKKQNGLSLGIDSLDEFTCLEPGQYIAIGARPSIGKTMLATHILEAVSRQGKTGLFFSVEMPKEDVVKRLLASGGNIPGHCIRTGNWEGQSIDRALSSTVGEVGNAKILIDDSPSISPIQIWARSRQAARKYDLGCVVIDYLQIVNPHTREGNREGEIRVMSASFKALARTLKIPVIVLCQLSRRVEERKDKKPELSDFRESGSIEQDADLALLLHRPDKYGLTEKIEIRGRQYDSQGKLCVLIAKQRGGVSGVAVWCDVNMEQTKIHKEKILWD
jgi:replicative DNA helicase